MGAGVGAALFAILIFSGKIPIGSSSGPKLTGTVAIWGTIPEAYMDGMLQQYNIQAKTYTVSYKEIKEDVFVPKLIDALANGTGPDMIIAPYQIILSQLSKIYPFPATSLPETTFKTNLVDAASVFWTPYGAIALPISVEPMVLFYNRSILSKDGIVNPPAYWNEVSDMAPAVNQGGNGGTFNESTIALGTVNNVPYAKDILMTMVKQLRQTPVVQNFTTNGVNYSISANDKINNSSDVLPLSASIRFFTQFSDPTKNTFSWNSFAPNAVDQFIAEKLALYIGYSGDERTIREQNQKLDLGVTYLPQAKGYNSFATGVRMYGITTLRQTKNSQVALTVEADFAGSVWGPQLAAALGGVPALKNLLSDPNLSIVLAKSTLGASAWYDIAPDATYSLFLNTINDIVTGRQNVTDGTDIMVARMSDLYNPK